MPCSSSASNETRKVVTDFLVRQGMSGFQRTSQSGAA